MGEAGEEEKSNRQKSHDFKKKENQWLGKKQDSQRNDERKAGFDLEQNSK